MSLRLQNFLKKNRIHCGNRGICWSPLFSPFLTFFSPKCLVSHGKSRNCAVKIYYDRDTCTKHYNAENSANALLISCLVHNCHKSAFYIQKPFLVYSQTYSFLKRSKDSSVWLSKSKVCKIVKNVSETKKVNNSW